MNSDDNREMKNSVEIKNSKTKQVKIVTAVIACLCILFVLLIAYNFIKRADNKDDTAVSASPAAAGSGQNPAAGGQSQGTGSRGAQGGRSAAAVRVTPVKQDTIENSVVINGEVQARNQVSIFPAMAGKLAELRLGIGDKVSRGDVVAMIDPSRPGEVYSHSPVVSTISGTILQAPYSIGDTLSTSSAVYVVGDLSLLRIETNVPERFVLSIRQGLGAQVRFEAIPGEIFYAEIDEISPVLDPASRTMKIKLRFADRLSGTVNLSGHAVAFSHPGSRIKAGMFATISLVTMTRANVPVIPRASVINSYGSWFVFVVDENGIARRHKIELGIENEEFIEVISGVNTGDRIVSAGQNFLSDGDPVRILE